jgi:hypothetical protein
MGNPTSHLGALEFLILYDPALILMMFHGRRRDLRIAKQPKTYEFSSRTLCRGHEALLGPALMALVSFPVIAWGIIFVLVISMVGSPSP